VDTERHFRTLFDRSPVGMATVSLEGGWLEVNDALVTFLGYDRDTLLTLDFQAVTHPEDLAPSLDLVRQVLEGRMDHYELTKRYVRADERVVWALLSVNLVREPGTDVPAYFICQVVDVDAQHRLEIELNRLRDERERAAAREVGALRHLVDLHADVATLDSEESALTAVVQAAMQVVPHGDGAVIELPEDLPQDGGEGAREVLRYRAVTGTLADQLGQVVDRHRSLSGRSYNTRSLLHSRDTEDDPRVDAAACRRTGIRSMLVAPLLAGREALGVIKVSSGRADAFDEVDEAALTMLAHSLTAALQHVRNRDLLATALCAAEEANVELARVDGFKTDLVGMLGHEIGNPLSVLAGATELALSDWGTDGPPAQRRYLELIERNAARIERTIAAVLSLVTAESGRLVAHPVVVDVAERAAEALAAADLPVEVTGRGTGAVHAWVQPEHLDQMLTNLVSNAVKYGAQPVVEVSTASPGRVRVAVVDRGRGVPAEFVDALFDRFTRSEETSRSARGTGLGLYIVRELARAAGGDVTHEPTPGGGATFVIDLPAARTAGSLSAG
jgi:PAS domain S-box-containing protein